ncbi:hypothetical protein MCUN1_001185 [Malassezia cuniculi]|uniref:Ataxin-10 homolog n=1 Tax=Malassezia cuniculi TaxID=948313 RepID=A0AAF0ETZ4_9BASI|nr:hypothetical protein MCUN1_001185 [Malassezia cuniculi]
MHALCGALRSHATQWTQFDRDAQEAQRGAPADALRALIGVVRNAVYESETNQLALLEHWDALVPLLEYCLPFERMNDPTLMPLVRVLAQLLANCMGGCAHMRANLWRRHFISLDTTSAPLEAVRPLLASADGRTVVAAQVCILHAVQASDTIDYAAELAHLSGGRDILEVLLSGYDAATGDDGPEAGAVLDIAVHIVRRLFERGHTSVLLDGSMGPMQITLLRVLADVLQERVEECATQHVAPLPRAAVAPLARLLGTLAHDAADIMHAHLASEETDLRELIRAHIALVALLDSLTSVAMAGHELESDAPRLAELRDDVMLEATVRLLNASHAFFPAQSPFQGTSVGEAPAGHVLSATGRAAQLQHQHQQHSQRPALHTLKRGAIRLLGKPYTPAVAAVQDRVREAGGLLDVLNATVLDETNPYMREHAIFTLRALLDRNEASQAQIAELRPIEPNTTG